MNSWFPRTSKPLPVEGGIRARSKRGAIAQRWWSERFIDVLESIVVGGRLQRGRAYARKGQVIDLDVVPGAATATVQGSRPEPYRVRIGLTAFDKTEWSRICAALAGNAWYSAKLLASEMPEDIEDVFAAEGLSLFPASADELVMDCSCPDWSVPCKHLAAVFYLLAESFDQDPFGILAWRGRARADLLDTLRRLRSASGAGDPSRSTTPTAPLTECADFYFAQPAEILRPAPVAAPPGAVLDLAPAVDLAVRGAPISDVLRAAYEVIGQAGDDPPQRQPSHEGTRALASDASHGDQADSSFSSGVRKRGVTRTSPSHA